MTTHCLDTDVLSALMKREIPAVLVRRISETGEAAVCTTAITVGEIVYGVAKRRSAELAERAETLLARGISILPFDSTAARAYGTLRTSLEADGTSLSDPDLRIASIALARDLTVVTHNSRHFRRVPGLRVEDWLEE